MKFEINDTVIVILLILLGLLVLGLLVALIYYKLEKRLKEKLQREIEGKPTQAKQSPVKKLERAGILDRHNNKFGPKSIQSQKGFDNFGETGKKVMILSGRENLILSSTSRYQPTSEGENPNEQVDAGPRLNLDDTKEAADYLPELGGRVPTEGDFWQSKKRNTVPSANNSVIDHNAPQEGIPGKSPYHEGVAGSNNTIDRIKNLRIEDMSMNDLSLDKSGMKSPTLTTVNIEYKAEAGSQNAFHFGSGVRPPTN